MIGRRDFLRNIGVGAAVASPSIVPSSALGREGSVAPGDRIVMGCIGVGRQGGGDMRGFLNEPDARVVAVCDVRQSARDRAADMVNNRNGDKQCVAYNDYHRRNLLNAIRTGRKTISPVDVAARDQMVVQAVHRAMPGAEAALGSCARRVHR